METGVLGTAANLGSARSHEEQLARLFYNQSVPHAAGHDDKLARLHSDNLRILCVVGLERHPHSTGDEEHELVALRVAFSPMFGALTHPHRPDTGADARRSLGDDDSAVGGAAG